MQVGIDIVDIAEFAKQIKLTDGKILDKLFSEHERAGKKLESLAGMLAAKEAAIKAGVIEVGQWLDVEITKRPSGAPNLHYVEVSKEFAGTISISHTKDIAVAVIINIATNS